jgi:phosphoribosylanthranilate isomerase
MFMKKIIISIVTLFTVLLFNSGSLAQNPATVQTAGFEVIQFHSEHRCVTCVKIEKLTRATLVKTYPGIPFRLINADDKKNAKIAEQFEATGTALFLYNAKTGKKKNLTEFAFMKAGNETAFDAELKKFITDFLKD